MTDNATEFEQADDPEFAVSEPIEQGDHRGSVMRELESWERIVDGMKMAADGARHVARHRSPDMWNKLALFLDTLRKAVITDGGFDRPEDAKETSAQWGGEGLSFTLAHRRLMDGLKMAAAGAEQIAQCQRMDLRWMRYAMQIRTMRDQAHKLALSGSPLVTEAGWRSLQSGLVVPARLH